MTKAERIRQEDEMLAAELTKHIAKIEADIEDLGADWDAFGMDDE